MQAMSSSQNPRPGRASCGEPKGNSKGNRITDAVLSVVVKRFSETERQEFLAAKRVAILSVEAADGRPPATIPIWYDYAIGGNIRFTTSAASRKAKLIARAGAVSLAVQREQPPYQYVVVEGTVVDTRPSTLEVQEAIAIRYLGEEAGRAFVRDFERTDSTLFTIRPDRWLTADATGDS